MFSKLAKILALSLLTCYIYLPGECEHPSPAPFGGGVVQPFAYNPQQGVGTNEPQAVEQSRVDEEIGAAALRRPAARVCVDMAFLISVPILIV